MVFKIYQRYILTPIFFVFNRNVWSFCLLGKEEKMKRVKEPNMYQSTKEGFRELEETDDSPFFCDSPQ